MTINSPAFDRAIPFEPTPEAITAELGTFKPYAPNMAITEHKGTRICKVLYRPKKGDKNPKQSVYVRLPSKHLTASAVSEHMAELMPHLIEFLTSKEDEIIRAEHSAGALSFYTDKLSIPNLIAYLEESNAGARLTSEAIAEWFTEYVEADLIEKLAAKKGINIEEASEAVLIKFQAAINAYSSLFCKLAGGRTSLKEEDRLALLSVIDKTGASDSIIGKRLKSRLEAMTAPTENLLEAL